MCSFSMNDKKISIKQYHLLSFQRHRDEITIMSFLFEQVCARFDFDKAIAIQSILLPSGDKQQSRIFNCRC